MMEDNNKRIVRNTVYLYVRMLVMMALGFITTRIVLEKLGVPDYGIYSLLGGFVSMFTVLNSILSTGTSRFIALALGKKDIILQKRTFSTAFVIHLFIAVIVLILLESFGLWYINTNLNIDKSRMEAANWVFQFSAISVALAISQTPFIATVTAYEKFNIYAMMSVFDAVAKLLILYLLIILPGDKLIVYASLLFGISFLNICIYRSYCIKKFEECSMSFKVDKTLLKEMSQFAGWSTLGHVVTVINTQGINILLNLFFNTVMNAARGLASTVSFMIGSFIAGFMTAAQPQLVKFYGEGDMKKFNRLIFNISQYSLFLIAIVMGPVLLEIDYVVDLWLNGNVPPYTTTFVRITMILTLVYRSNSMIETGIQASGYVKVLNLLSVPVYFIVLPIVYFTLKMGWGPVTAIWLANIAPVITFFINLVIIQRTIHFPSLQYFFVCFFRTSCLILISLLVPYLAQQQMNEGFLRFVVVCTISVLCTFVTVWFWGFNEDVRAIFREKILGKFFKKYKK